jgi:tripartite-type tricarboxylate transporter receptor subunit TctC
MQEAGVANYEVSGWLGIFAPKGIAPDNLKILEQAMNSTLKDPQVQAALAKIIIEPTPGTAKVLNEKLDADTKRWSALIKKRKLDLQ